METTTYPERADGVRELDPADPAATVCGTCGRGWDDAHVTSSTPAPAGRCPFEYEHEHAETDHTRWARLALAHVEELGGPESIKNAGELDDANPAPWLLVQKSTCDGGYWLTFHDSPEDAAGYIDGEEYPGDWSTEYVVELATGARRAGVVRTAFGDPYTLAPAKVPTLRDAWMAYAAELDRRPEPDPWRAACLGLLLDAAQGLVNLYDEHELGGEVGKSSGADHAADLYLILNAAGLPVT